MARLGRAYPVQRIFKPPPGGAPVIFDAVGAGAASGSSGFSWSHTIGTSARAVLVGVSSQSGNALTVKVGSTSMTQLGSFFSFGPTVYMSLWELLNPPTGAQTIAVSGAGAANAGNSVSYNNVSGFGTVATNSGSGTTASQSITSATGQMVFQMFAYGGSAGQTFSAYNQTSRWVQAGVSSVTYPAMIGDAPGAATVNFSATISSGSWGAIAVPLLHS